MKEENFSAEGTGAENTKEMNLPDKERGDLFLRRLREVRGRLLEVDSEGKESKQLQAEIDRLAKGYAEALFEQNKTKESGFWMILGDLEEKDIQETLDGMRRINLSIEKMAREEEEEDSGKKRTILH
jgi:hypothetical protein